MHDTQEVDAPFSALIDHQMFAVGMDMYGRREPVAFAGDLGKLCQQAERCVQRSQIGDRLGGS